VSESVLESAYVHPKTYSVLSHGLPKAFEIECHIVTRPSQTSYDFWTVTDDGGLNLVRSVNEVITVGLVG
jgi:hypothetical protein